MTFGYCRWASISTKSRTKSEGFAVRPDIQEVDLNPVTVYAVGQGALALDALIVMNAPDGRTMS